MIGTYLDDAHFRWVFGGLQTKRRRSRRKTQLGEENRQLDFIINFRPKIAVITLRWWLCHILWILWIIPQILNDRVIFPVGVIIVIYF